jgi:hypothetical protein
LIVSAIALGTLLARAAPETVAVRILDRNTGRVVGTVAVDSRGEFRLVFTHSMYGGTVAETYQVYRDPSEKDAAPLLRRSMVRTERGGAAEYYARSGNFSQDGGGWIVDAPPLTLSSLQIRVDGTGQPEIIGGQERVALLSLVADGRVVELRPVALSRGSP